MILIMFFCALFGFLLFANYYDCDPIAAGIVNSGNVVDTIGIFSDLRLKKFLIIS